MEMISIRRCAQTGQGVTRKWNGEIMNIVDNKPFPRSIYTYCSHEELSHAAKYELIPTGKYALMLITRLIWFRITEAPIVCATITDSVTLRYIQRSMVKLGKPNTEMSVYSRVFPLLQINDHNYKTLKLDNLKHESNDACDNWDSDESAVEISIDRYVDDLYINAGIPVQNKHMESPITDIMRETERADDYILCPVSVSGDSHVLCPIMPSPKCSPQQDSAYSSKHVIITFLIAHCLINSFLSIIISFNLYILIHISYVRRSFKDKHLITKETLGQIETSKSESKTTLSETKSFLKHLSPMCEPLDVESDTSDDLGKCLESKLLNLREQTWLPLVDTLPSNPEMTVAPVFQPLTQILDRVATGERVPPEETMQYETLRFYSLRDYPRENKPFLIQFARAGFYYANVEDEVICYVCGQRIRNWTEDDDPLEIHKKISPNCRFHTHNSEVNVPIAGREDDAAEKETTATSTVPSTGVVECTTGACGTSDDLPCAQGHQKHLNGYETSQESATEIHKHSNGYEVTHEAKGEDKDAQSNTKHPNGILESNQPVVKETGGPSESIYNQAIFQLTQPSPQTAIVGHASGPPSTHELSRSITPLSRPSRNPSYSTYDQRLESFAFCPRIARSHSSLAEAGFYYAGMGDCTKCFHCGLGLRNWDEADDPFVEHARHSEDCEYVRLQKGQEFINLVRLSTLDINDDDVTGYSSGIYSQGGAGLPSIHTSSNMNEDRATSRPTNNPNPAMNGIAIDDSLEIPEDPKARLEFQKRLHQENEEMKRQAKCSGCLEKDATILFLPCGHLVTCAECAPRYTACLVCNSVIKGTVQTFRP